MELVLPRIERIAAARPAAVAIETPNRSVSYDELIGAVRQMQSALAARGVAKNSLVALLLPNAPEFVIAHLALLQLGAITFALHPDSPARDLESALGECKPAGIIMGRAALQTLGRDSASLSTIPLRILMGESPGEGWFSFAELQSGDMSSEIASEIAEQDVAVIAYAHGVTGSPCAVELTHSNFAHQAHQIGRALRLRDTDRVFRSGSFSSIFGLTLGVHLPLVSGATIVLGDHYSDMVDTVRQRNVTVLTASPAEYARLNDPVADSSAEPASLRLAICCDGKLPEETRRKAEARLGREIVMGCGLVETCGLFALNLHPHEENRLHVGEPLAETEIAILDENGKRKGAGSEGRIAVRGPSVMQGYRNAPDRSKDALKDGWLLTNCFGSVDYHGSLNVLAYSGERVVKGGFPVYVGEIEGLLRSHAAIKDVVVVGVPDQVYGEELKACIVLRNGTNIAPNDVIQFAKEQIPVYKCPRIVKFYKELPHTPDGRIRRAALRDDKS